MKSDIVAMEMELRSKIGLSMPLHMCMSAQCNAERRNCFADVWMNHDSVAGTVHK